MSIQSFGKTKWIAYFVLAAFTALAMPITLPAADPGALGGFVYAKDAKSPVAGAVVKLRNIADMKEMASAPTDANGMYTINGIPEGRYLVGVTSTREDFNLEYALYIKAGELGKLSIALAPTASGGQEEPQATVKKRGFFSTVAGRILVVTAVGVGLYFLIVEPDSSPIR